MRPNQSLFLMRFAALCLFAQVASAQPDSLNFFNNWFVTGDYTVAGVGLANTGGKGAITMNSVPCTGGTGLLSAIVPCRNTGASPAYPVAAFLYWETVESSATAAGAKGTFDGNAIVGTPRGSDSSSACWLNTKQAPSQTLRVYRADVLRFLPIDPTSGLRLANYMHTVALGNGAPGGNAAVLTTEGASLVVIYRVVVPGNRSLAPLRSIVIYDGEFTLKTNKQTMSQNVAGFYQASSEPEARMTHIVGNGQTVDGDAAFRGNLTVNGETPDEMPDHPFGGAQGGNWDNLSFDFDLRSNASSALTQMHKTDNAPSCLSWSAVVASTEVQDSDGDGLLDVWESKGIHRNTQVSPATFGGCADYPSEPCVNLPAMGAQNGVQDVFLQMDWMHGYGDGTGGIDNHGSHDHIPQLSALSMVAQAFAAHHINLHFDVGNNYQGLSYIVPYKDSRGNVLAQGGSDIDENSLKCANSQGHTCTYQEPYPVLSFKLGLASVRDGNHLLNIPAHFAQNRKDAFHYVLFAHALAGPFDLAGKPATTNPASTSGVGDRPGGDVMVTLGLWRSVIPANDQVGSVQVQAGTLMHELGHNLDLSHGGWNATPNCMPNYQSVMSYLYQTRGLTDANGVEHIDYSSGYNLPLIESALNAKLPIGFFQQYRVRYYTPFNPQTNSAGQASQLHCNGTPITDGAMEIRAESATLATPDWSNGTVPIGTSFPLDVNFDGIGGQTFYDQPDWTSLNLQQIGGRTNFGSLSTGSLATDAGSLATDAGSLATDAGSLATDAGSLATDAGADEDYDTHIKASTDGIPGPQQCAGCGLTSANGLTAIALSWTPPGTGGNLTYNIYRCAGAGCVPTAPANKIFTGYNPASAASPNFTDTVNNFKDAGGTCPSTPTTTCFNTTYTYAVTAVSTAGIESPYSNTTSSEVTHLFVIANIQAAVYGAANPTASFQVYGDVANSLASGVSCAYQAAAKYNAGVYTITCTGPAVVPTLPNDGVTYNATYVGHVPGSLTVSPRPITVTAAANTKTYDGGVSAAAIPVIGPGALQYTDTNGFLETYDNKNVGATHTLTVSGIVNDDNGGANYTVTKVAINSGAINRAPLSIAAATNTKTYDANISAAAAPVVTGLQTGDSMTGLAETYDTPNAGTGKTLSVSAYTVVDGNSGANYSVSTVPNTTGVINKANPTVVVTPYGVTYDGQAHTATGSVKGVLNEALTGLDVGGTIHTNAGTYSNDPWAFTDTTGNYNNAGGTVGDTIAKASATITVTPYSVTYDENPHTATATATGVQGESLFFELNLSGTVHTAAGTYSSDAWALTDTTGNYNNAAGTVSDTIAKANATITVTPYSVTYDGSPHTAAGTATGAKGEPISGLAVTGTTHTNAGNYATDSWTFTDSAGNYNTAGATITDTIGQATVTVTVTPYSVTYDGSPHTATGNAAGVGGVFVGGLNLGGTTHTNAGASVDSWTFSDPNGNYTSTSGTVFDSIAKANPTVVVVPYSVTYDGNPHTATGTATGAKGETLSGLALIGTHTNAGSYTDSWTFTDGTGNYNNAGANITDSIAKANPTVVVVPYSVTYDGNPHMAIGTAAGVAGDNLSTGLNLTGTIHTGALTYSDSWTFTDPTGGNYNTVSGPVIDSISKAAATVTLSNLTQAYTGSPLSPTVTTIQPGLAYSLSGAPDTNAGTYAVTATVTDPNYTGSASGNFVITPVVGLGNLVLNGNASMNGNALRLTNNASSETSSAWSPTQVAVGSGFHTTFQFQITNTPGQTPADGFAFVIQSAPSGATTLGTTGQGGYLGYQGIPNSIAVEFDTYQNSDYGDPAAPHIGIQSAGTQSNTADHTGSANLLAATPPTANLLDGNVHTVSVTYDGTTLSVFLDGSNTAIASAAVNLSNLLGLTGGQAYVGFTGATGALAENSDILSWTWNQ